MRALARATIIVVSGACIATAVGCASGRVRGAQGTEMGQAREYEPQTKVEPPTGNVDRTSGPLEQPEAYPILEIDLDRRREPPPGPEPQPEPRTPPEPQPGNNPE